VVVRRAYKRIRSIGIAIDGAWNKNSLNARMRRMYASIVLNEGLATGDRKGNPTFSY